MKKRMMFAMSGLVAVLLAALLSTSGCAKASVPVSSNGATVFFPNVSI